jgi:hypothetical protein
LNYLGSVFVPTDEQLSSIQEVINNFILKNLRISEQRLYLSPEKGGLGFFNFRAGHFRYK